MQFSDTISVISVQTLFIGIYHIFYFGYLLQLWYMWTDFTLTTTCHNYGGKLTETSQCRNCSFLSQQAPLHFAERPQPFKMALFYGGVLRATLRKKYYWLFQE